MLLHQTICFQAFLVEPQSRRLIQKGTSKVINLYYYTQDDIVYINYIEY